MPGSPSHHAVRAFCVRYQYRGVAFASAGDDYGDIAIRDASNRVDDFEYRVTGPGAQIEHAGVTAVAKIVKRTHMRSGEVGDMDEITNRRPVLGRIVGAENA